MGDRFFVGPIQDLVVAADWVLPKLISLPILGSTDRKDWSSGLLNEWFGPLGRCRCGPAPPTLLEPWTVLRVSLLVRRVVGGSLFVWVRLTDLGLGIGFLLVDRERPPECVSEGRFPNLGDVTGGRPPDLVFVPETRIVLRVLRRLALEERSLWDDRVWLIDRPLLTAAIDGCITIGPEWRCALIDPSGFRVRDLPLRDDSSLPLRDDSFFDSIEEDLARFAFSDIEDALIIGGATDLDLELPLWEDLVRDDCRSEDEDSDDDAGFESSLDAEEVVKVVGGRFLWTIIGWSSFRFERESGGADGAGGATGAHEASELIGFFIQVATLIVSSLLLFLPDSLRVVE